MATAPRAPFIGLHCAQPREQETEACGGAGCPHSWYAPRAPRRCLVGTPWLTVGELLLCKPSVLCFFLKLLGGQDLSGDILAPSLQP